MNVTGDHISSASSTTSARSKDRHVVLRHRLSVDGIGAPIIGGEYLLAVLRLTGTVSAFTEIVHRHARITELGTPPTLLDRSPGGVTLTARFPT